MNKIQKFLEEYGKLVEKHHVDFANYPMFVPDEKGTFKIVIQSTPIDLDDVQKQKEAQDFIKRK